MEDVLAKGMHYLFVAKPDDHEYMMSYIKTARECSGVGTLSFKEKDRTYKYEWINDVPLNKRSDTIRTNYLSLTITQLQKDGSEKITYRSSWVTDIEVNQSNVQILVKAGRGRWKLENECFNTLKNQGYSLDHNYGHGKKHLAFNLYLLTLIAFLFHQIFELTDRVYQACRQKFGSKKELWDSLRASAKFFAFDSWEMLLDFALSPKKYRPQMQPP